MMGQIHERVNSEGQSESIVNKNNRRPMQGKQTKVVKVDLMAESRRHAKDKLASTKRTTSPGHEFSFSQDYDSFPEDPRPSPSPTRQTITKTLFTPSPKRQPEQPQLASSRERVHSVRRKYESYNRNYEHIDEKDQIYKKSIDKIKRAIFHDNRNNKNLTVKTLREIGRYAQQKLREQATGIRPSPSKSPPKVKDIPVGFYSWSPKPSPPPPTPATYLDFEQRYKQQLQSSQSPTQRLESNKTIAYSGSPVSKLKAVDFPSPPVVAAEEKVEDKHVDTVCQIFQLCDKFNEGDRIVKEDLAKLVEQLERLYFIKVIQESEEERRAYTQPAISEQEFFSLLRDLSDCLQIIFYRREANDIYDAIYYLRQTGRLALAGQLFSSIKRALSQ